MDILYSLRVGVPGSGPNGQRFNLLEGTRKVARATTVDALGAVFATDLELTMAATTSRRLFVHAGVVGWRGRAIVLPGRSFSGKTTLVLALVRAGARYYSDDFALLDAGGRVHPYTREPSVRPHGSDTGVRVPLTALGGRVGRKPLPVGLVLISEYQPDAAWQPEPLSPGAGALALLAHTVAARTQPAIALTTLSAAVIQATVLQGPRGDAESVATTILSHIT
ncbi:MAG TPA: hypothetical protein VM536_21445 [Chloroflexia bacterium]|nr:hypothetical protein [Chloroflexia bacterium]